MKKNESILDIISNSTTLDKSAFLKEGWYFGGSFLNKDNAYSLVQAMNFKPDSPSFIIIQREIPINVTTHPNLSEKAVFKKVLINALFTKNIVIPSETIQLYGGLI